MPDASPTLAEMATKISPRLTFTCDPCRRIRIYEPSDLIELYGADLTLARLRRRIACAVCRMPVDGDFRRLDYHTASSLDGFGGRLA